MAVLGTHMHFRIADQEKLLVEQAAKLVGLKPNTYARRRLLEAVEKDLETLSNEQKLFLDEETWDQLVAIIEKPYEENRKLKRAAARHKKMVK